MTEISRSPLCWPPGWRRTPEYQRKRAQFKRVTKETRQWADGSTYTSTRGRELTINDGIQRILAELRAMGTNQDDVIVSTNLRLRNDGFPVSNQATSHLDQGVAVYWFVKGASVPRCMAIDRYDRIADNLAAIAATLDAMRAIERHGGAEILDRAFTGFAALPAPRSQEEPHEVLGVERTAKREEIDYAYRRLAQQCHPDKGGSVDAMARINAARDAMLRASP